MGRVAQVKAYELDDDNQGEVKADLGGDDIVSAAHFHPSGDDSPPLPGDYVAVEGSSGRGTAQASGYSDVASSASPGEKRLYARDEGGNLVCVIYLKTDGSLSLQSPDGAATQAFVRGDAQAQTLKDLGTALDTLMTALTTYTAAIAGVADPSNAATPTLHSAITTFRTALTTFSSGVDAALSTVIKGE